MPLVGISGMCGQTYDKSEFIAQLNILDEKTKYLELGFFDLAYLLAGLVPIEHGHAYVHKDDRVLSPTAPAMFGETCAYKRNGLLPVVGRMVL